MKTPESLQRAFEKGFDELIAEYSAARGLIPEASSLGSERFLSRSVLPHILKLSGTFNRQERDQAEGLSRYWKESSNPKGLRLAYFLYFMPPNLCRVASVWSELARLGFRWPEGQPLRAIEFGAGPASGACGIAAGEKHASVGLPRSGTWALIEQDKAMLQLGAGWAEQYFTSLEMGDWGTRTFHRTLDIAQPLLPRNAPGFNLWLMSFFLNESDASPSVIAANLLETWERHLEEEGIVILVEPALKLQSRRLLELRRELIEQSRKKNADWLQVLLPCLGHQACGALASPEDWCHEEATWWRPKYYRVLDDLAKLDHKTLPFSYLVLVRSRRPRGEILRALGDATKLERLVSPAHKEGQDSEFFMCGADGKRRARLRQGDREPLQRGDILVEPEVRGDPHASRVEKIKGTR